MKIEFKNIHGIKTMLKSIQGRTSNMWPVLIEVGAYLKESVRDNFMAGGRPNTWKPLKKTGAPSHLYSKLSTQGNLYNSIKADTSNTGVDIYSEGVVYADIHQFGGAAGKGRSTFVPPRPYLVMQREDKAHIVEMVKRYLMGN